MKLSYLIYEIHCRIQKKTQKSPFLEISAQKIQLPLSNPTHKTQSASEKYSSKVIDSSPVQYDPVRL